MNTQCLLLQRPSQNFGGRFGDFFGVKTKSGRVLKIFFDFFLENNLTKIFCRHNQMNLPQKLGKTNEKKWIRIAFYFF